MQRIILLFISLFITTACYLKSQDLENLINKINIDTLINNVSILSGEKEVKINNNLVRIDSRKFDSEKKHLAALWIKSKLEEYGYSTEIIEFAKNEETVIARKTGSNNNNLVIIGAHYDSFNYDPGPAPGANDNASGCSAVLEISRVLKDVELNSSLEFIFWDGEETGMKSSMNYVDGLTKSTNFLLGYINLDMLAWESNDDGKVRIKYKDSGNSYFLAVQATNWISKYALNLKPELITHSWWGDGDCDSFWRKGLTSIGIADFMDYYESYHNSNDLIKLFNNDYYLENTKLAFIITYKLSVGDNLSVNPGENAFNKSNQIIKATKGQIIELTKKINLIDIEIYDILGSSIDKNKIHELPESIYLIKYSDILTP